MSEKKDIPLAKPKGLPPGVVMEELPGGDWLFTIKRNRLTITCRYNPDSIKAEIGELFSEMFKFARTGEKPDYDIHLSGINIDRVIEVKSRNVQRVPGASDEELEHQRVMYVEKAWRQFLEEFHLELHRMPAKYLFELKNVVVARLEPYGLLITKQGITKLYNDVLSTQKKDFKKRYNAPAAGDAQSTTPRERAKLLEAYERYYKLIKEVKAKSNPKKRKPGWEKEVKALLGKIGFEIVGRLHKIDKVNGGNSPSDIALELAAKECDMLINTNTPKILTKARKELRGERK
jgi:hypothetical protein